MKILKKVILYLYISLLRFKVFQIIVTEHHDNLRETSRWGHEGTGWRMCRISSKRRGTWLISNSSPRMLKVSKILWRMSWISQRSLKIMSRIICLASPLKKIAKIRRLGSWLRQATGSCQPWGYAKNLKASPFGVFSREFKVRVVASRCTYNL